MDIFIFLGLGVAALAFYFGVPDLRTDIQTYLQLESFILVTGGTIAATMISASSTQLKNVLSLFRQLVFQKKQADPGEILKRLVSISEKAQSMSKQALVEEGNGIDDGFLARALELIAGGLDTDFIRNTLETDIIEIQRRHQMMTTMVRSMGTFAPMFGMTGTVLGVVKVLQNVTDINNIVAGMSLALLTTLYGLLYSSIIFIPLTNKLRGKTAQEVIVKEMILEGVLMINQKEIPLKVEKYLMSYLSTKTQKRGKK